VSYASITLDSRVDHLADRIERVLRGHLRLETFHDCSSRWEVRIVEEVKKEKEERRGNDEEEELRGLRGNSSGSCG